MMTLVTDLLARGYFPDRIPPPFSTASFGDCMQAQARSVPSEFLADKKTRELDHYNVGRPGQLRRRFGLPNPVSYFRLAIAIESGWTEIEAHLAGSPFSLSVPIVDESGHRALVPSVPFWDLPEHKPLKRDAARFLIQTDIANFYPSIYTHSIPWALHSKAVAKRKKNDQALLGNRLDTILRDGQFGQTKGIPVGSLH